MASSPSVEVKKEDGQAWGSLMPLNSDLPSASLVGNEFWIGRLPECNVSVGFNALSGKHCKIFRHDDKSAVYLENLSKNATFVNRKRVESGSNVTLKNGDEISLLAPDADTAKKNNIHPFVNYIFKDLRAETLEGAEKDYNFVKQLGAGSFASVKLAVHKETGEKVAVKMISKAIKMPNPNKSLMDEVEILRKLSHPNIIRVLNIYETPLHLQLVLELVNGGDLLDRILSKERYTEPEAKILFKNILEAVEYLHSHGFAHRDLKPENILLVAPDDDVTIKLTDFGVSRSFDCNQLMGTIVGTPQYLAPEIIKKGRGAEEGYTVAVDLWSLGVILYVLLSGFPPFKEGDYNRILTANFSFNYSEWKSISKEAKDLITKLLTVDPTKRYTAKQALAHPWITGEELPAEEDKAEKEEAEGKKGKGKSPAKPKPETPHASPYSTRSKKRSSPSSPSSSNSPSASNTPKRRR